MVLYEIYWCEMIQFEVNDSKKNKMPMQKPYECNVAVIKQDPTPSIHIRNISLIVNGYHGELVNLSKRFESHTTHSIQDDELSTIQCIPIVNLDIDEGELDAH